MKILHVTQCYDGGVSRAIDNITFLTPEIDHHILYLGTENPKEQGNYSGVYKFAGSHSNRFRMVRELVKDLEVDVVHAHSSWAGLYARGVTLPAPVIYAPHCFVFDDPKRNIVLRSIYRLVEQILSKKTFLTLALTDHEHRLAKGLNRRGKVTIIPNVPTIPVVSHRKAIKSERPVISMIGRVAPQKDPGFYLEIVAVATQRNLPFHFVWIGDGDPDMVGQLRQAGVEVTGWLDAKQISERLSDTWMYVHSASYEGFPLSVLDAAAAKVPIVVRDIPCFDGTELAKANTAEDIVEILESALSDPDHPISRQTHCHNLLDTMNAGRQTDILRESYEMAGAR